MPSIYGLFIEKVLYLSIYGLIFLFGGILFMKEKSCCFTGHRIIKKTEIDLIKSKLKDVVIKLINDDINIFICGGALGFDTIAAQEILAQKNTYKDIKLILALPCKEQDKNWKEKEIVIYKSILQRADKIIYVSDEYSKDCMLKRNRYMVDNSNFCICYLRNKRSGTAYTVNYAKNNNSILIYF